MVPAPAVQMPGELKLLHVIQALDGLRPSPGLGQCWQKQARQDCDDRSDDQQFDERESRPLVSMAMINVNAIGDLPNLRTQFGDVFS